MDNLKLGQMRIPDILETIADLSNDEVFTPPQLANKVLDMLPKEIWSNPKIKFLDPACKTGVFLREITKRLIEGLKDEIPDLQERVNHILTKQVFGLGITELTALMSRRTVYCSTKANSDSSVCTAFDNPEGNIKFPKSKHIFNEKNKKCEICGAGADLYGEIPGLDNYAYSFLHDNLKEVFGNVKFDVIIGNPPYQLNLGNEGGNSSKARAIYHNFIDKALELNPRYISMIVPSKWLTNSADDISSEWVKSKLSSGKFKAIVDYENSDELFKSVSIYGGVNYFLIDSEYKGKCDYTHIYNDGSSVSSEVELDSLNIGVAIRDLRAVSILEKIKKIEGNKYYKNNSFSKIVSPSGYYKTGNILTTSWRDYSKSKSAETPIKYYVSESTNGIPFGWINKKQIPKNDEIVDKFKVFIPFIHGGAKQILGEPIYGEKGSICSQTYLAIGYNNHLTNKQAENTIRYISTKFFRFLVKILKRTQMGSAKTYTLVPLSNVDFNFKDDRDLYKKYKLTEEEINYIENSISEMNVSKELKRAMEDK